MEVVILGALAAYYIVSNSLQVLFGILSYRGLHKRREQRTHYQDFLSHYPELPLVSVIVPAFNEAPTIVDAVHSLLRIFYPKLEILIVNDGSKDQTQPLLQKAFSLKETPLPRFSFLSHANIHTTWVSKTEPKIRVIEQLNAGKSNALNTGIDYAQGQFVVTLDADTLVEEDALIRTIPLYLNNPHLIGIGGVIRIANGSTIRRHQVVRGKLPRNVIPLFQVIEYMRAFHLGRLSWDQLDATLLLSGAFSVFKKEMLIQVGGFDPESITEDFEIVVRMRQWLAKNKGKGEFRLIPEPVCWTQAPETLSHLQKQRWRWQRGLISTLWKHRSFLFSRRSGWAGWGAFPYLLFFECLSPIFDLAAIIALSHHLMNKPHFGHQLNQMFMIACIGLGFSYLLSLIAIHWTEAHFRRHSETKRSKWEWTQVFIQFTTASLFEMFLFHPLVAWWKLQALILHPFLQNGWGAKPRSALNKDTPPGNSKETRAA